VGCAVAACNAKGFSRTVDVTFSDTATQQDRDNVVQQCGTLPHASPLPQAPANSATARSGIVSFDITHASDAEISKLYACLSGKPGVLGVSEPDDN
jgi:hypothetical protein